MMGTRRATAVVAACAVFSLWGCGPQRVRTPEVTGSDLVLLLRDADGTTGGAVVSTPGGSTQLDAEREYTRVSASRPPTAAAVMTEADVQRLFGDVLATLPAAPVRFILNFRFESDELTAESRALFGQILQAVKDRPASELAIVGHTDTAGTPARNFQLGLRRAQTIHKLLVAEGLNAVSIDVTSHGEGNPLVRTADNTPEPRNRRVEISIR